MPVQNNDQMLDRSLVEDIIAYKCPELLPKERARAQLVLDMLSPDQDGALPYAMSVYMLARAGAQRAAAALMHYLGPSEARLEITPRMQANGAPEKINALFWPGSVKIRGSVQLGLGRIMGRLEVMGDLHSAGVVLAGAKQIHGQESGQTVSVVTDPAMNLPRGVEPMTLPIEEAIYTMPAEDVPVAYSGLRGNQVIDLNDHLELTQ